MSLLVIPSLSISSPAPSPSCIPHLSPSLFVGIGTVQTLAGGFFGAGVSYMYVCVCGVCVCVWYATYAGGIFGVGGFLGPDYPISDSMQPAGAVSSGPACTCTSCTGRYKFKSSLFFFFRREIRSACEQTFSLTLP